VRVLLWSTNYFRYIGGLERLTHNLALSLVSNGHSVLVVTDNPSNQTRIEDNIDGINVVRLPFSHALLQKNLPLIKTTTQGVSKLIEQFDPDVVNSHGWYETMCFYQTRAIENTKKPHCLTIHGMLEQQHYQTTLCSRVWHQSKAISTVSYAMAAKLNEADLTHEKLRVIHNGASLSERTSPQLILKPATTKKLLCIGRLSSEKGFDIMLHAFKRLHAKQPDIELTIVGDGPLYSDLLLLANSLGIAEQIKMPGPMAPHETDAFIDDAALVVVPSTYESFGLVALEAAMRSRAVVASDVLGLREVVADGLTGVLVSPGNPATLADAIESLINDPKKRQRMGEQARSRAQMLFNLDLMTQRYVAMYEECLS